MTESVKIRGKIAKYLAGEVVDIGCGDDLVCPHAGGIDGRSFPHVQKQTSSLYDLDTQFPEMLGKFDCCFSSHVLEHLPDHFRAILEWSKLLKSGGYFILYLPDGNYYNTMKTGSIFTTLSTRTLCFGFAAPFVGKP